MRLGEGLQQTMKKNYITPSTKVISVNTEQTLLTVSGPTSQFNYFGAGGTFDNNIFSGFND